MYDTSFQKAVILLIGSDAGTWAIVELSMRSKFAKHKGSSEFTLVDQKSTALARVCKAPA